MPLGIVIQFGVPSASDAFRQFYCCRDILIEFLRRIDRQFVRITYRYGSRIGLVAECEGDGLLTSGLPIDRIWTKFTTALDGRIRSKVPNRRAG